jgi:uncharacterized protein (TIRG00374 family)
LNKRYKRYLSWLVGVGLVIGLLLFAGPAGWEQLRQAAWHYLLPALALTGLIQLLAAARWHFLLGQVTTAAPAFAHVLHHTLNGAAVGLFAPSRDLGEMGARVASLKASHPLPLRHVALSVMVDRLFDVLIVIPFALAGLPFLLGGWRHPWLLGLCYVTAVALMALLLADGRGVRRLLRLMGSVYAWAAAGWRRLRPTSDAQAEPSDALSGIEDALSPRLLLGAFGLTVIKYCAFALRAYLVIKAVGAAIPAASLLLALPLSQASLLLAVTPGGVGITEMGWVGALSLLGISGGVGASFAVAHRLVVTISVLGIALMGQAAYAVAHPIPQPAPTPPPAGR